MKSNEYLCDLQTLRNIAFTCWDPIGIAGSRNHHEDEYDAYILQAAGLAIRGRSREDVAEFLIKCCSEMGIGGDAAKAAKAAQAIFREVFGAKLAVV